MEERSARSSPVSAARWDRTAAESGRKIQVICLLASIFRRKMRIASQRRTGSG